MKKIIFLSSMLCMFLTGALAQEKKIFKWDQATIDAVGLTAEQIQKFDQIKQEAKTALSVVMKDKSLSEEEKAQKRKEIIKRRNDAHNALLTAQQKEKVNAIVKAIQKENREREKQQ